MAKLNDNTTETVEIATDEDVYVPIAGTDNLGVASFNSEDFTVAQDGKVSLINKVAGIQFLGTITAASDSMLTWKISEHSDGDIEAPVAGDKIMLLESIAFNYDESTGVYTIDDDGTIIYDAGMIFVITSVQSYDASTLEPVYTDNECKADISGADGNVEVGTVTTNTVYTDTADVSINSVTSKDSTTLNFEFNIPNVGKTVYVFTHTDTLPPNEYIYVSVSDMTWKTDAPTEVGIPVLGLWTCRNITLPKKTYNTTYLVAGTTYYTDLSWLSTGNVLAIDCSYCDIIGDDGADGADGTDGSDGSNGTDGVDGEPAYVGKIGVLGYDVTTVNFADVTWINYTPTTDLECVIYLSEYSDDTEETIITELCVGTVQYSVGLVAISNKVTISGADASDIDTSLFVLKSEFDIDVNALIDADISERIDQKTLIGEDEYNEILKTQIKEGTIIGSSEYENLFKGSSVLNLVDVNSAENGYGTAVINVADIELVNSEDLYLNYYTSEDATQIVYTMSVNGKETAIPLSISTDTSKYQLQLTVGDGTDASVISASVPKVTFATSTNGGINVSDTFGVNTTLYPVVNSTGSITFATSYTTNQNVLSKATDIFGSYALSSTVTTNYNTLNSKFNDYVATANLASYFTVTDSSLYVNGQSVGEVTVSLDGYATTEYINTELAKYLLVDTASTTYAKLSALDAYTKTTGLAAIIEAYNYTTLDAVEAVGYLTAIPTLYASVDPNGAITVSTTAGTGSYNYISNYVSPFDISAYKIVVSDNTLTLSTSGTAVTTSSLATLLDSNFMTANEVTSAIEAYNYTTLTEVASVGYLTNSIFGSYSSLAAYLSGNGYVTDAVTSVSGGTTNGTIIVKTSTDTTGTAVAVAGLGSAAYTDESAYATASQGAKADSAVQSVSNGTSNGTILVDGSAVLVYGLGSAAYTASTAYAASSDLTTLSNTVSTLSSKVSTLESSSGSTITDYIQSIDFFMDDNNVFTIRSNIADSTSVESSLSVYPVINSDGTVLLSNVSGYNDLANAISFGTTDFTRGIQCKVGDTSTTFYPSVQENGAIYFSTSTPNNNNISKAISISGTTLTVFGSDYSLNAGSGVTYIGATFDNDPNSSTAGQITINVDDLTTTVNINDFIESVSTGLTNSILYSESSTGFVKSYLPNYFVKSNSTVYNTSNYTYMELDQYSDYLWGYYIGDNGESGFLGAKIINTSRTLNTGGIGYRQVGGNECELNSITYPNGMQVSTLIMGYDTSTVNIVDEGNGYIDMDRLVEEAPQASYIQFANDYTGGVAYLYGTWESSVDISSGSDENLKNTIEDMSDNYETLFDNLRPVTFKYNNGTSNRLHTGFIAQDVISALTSAELTTQDFAAVIKNSKTGYYSIRYGELVALCVQKIQKLDARVKDLEAANSDFESRIAALEAKLSE